MALTDILEKIEKETELKILEQKADFDKKKKALEKQFEEKKENIEKSIKGSVEEKKDSIMEKAKSLSHRESQNSLLFEKRKLIYDCFEKAIEKLLVSSNYTNYIELLIKNTPYEEGEIIPAEGKEAETKKALKANSKKFIFSEKSAKIKGGFIFKSNLIEIDNSFETIIKKQLKEDLEIKLNKLLF